MDPSSIVEVALQADLALMSRWSDALLILGIACLAVTVVAMFFDPSERLERRIFWSGWIVGSTICALALSPQGWTTSIAVFATGLMMAFIWSYFSTGEMIKIRGRAISFRSPERAASRPDSYLDITAPKYWWLIAFGTCCLAAFRYVEGPGSAFTWVLFVAIAFAAVVGLIDAGYGFQVARGQWVQFAIASVGSLALFALPLLAYLAAYLAATRWPERFRTPYMRRRLQHDLGRDASPEVGNDSD